MKKSLICFAAAVLLLPAALFAAPSDEEVAATVEGVMGVYGVSIMAAMFGATPPDGSLEMVTDEAAGEMTLIFSDFPARSVLEEMNSAFGEADEEDLLACPFETMSGRILTSGTFNEYEEPNIHIDLQLTGGKVQTLEMRMDGENGEVFLKANGHRYTNVEKIFEEAGFEDQ